MEKATIENMKEGQRLIHLKTGKEYEMAGHATGSESFHVMVVKNNQPVLPRYRSSIKNFRLK